MADIADSIGSCLGITDDGGSGNGFGKKLFVGLKKKFRTLHHGMVTMIICEFFELSTPLFLTDLINEIVTNTLYFFRMKSIFFLIFDKF